MKALPSVVIAMLLCGCAGTRFTFDQAAQVQIGMSEQDVTRIMGKPYMCVTEPDRTKLVYSYADGFSGRARAISFMLDTNGIVTSVPRIPESYLRRTNSVPMRVDLQSSKGR